MRPSPLRDELEAAGAAFAEISEHEVARDYGDVAGEYAAAPGGPQVQGRIGKRRRRGARRCKGLTGLIHVVTPLIQIGRSRSHRYGDPSGP